MNHPDVVLHFMTFVHIDDLVTLYSVNKMYMRLAVRTLGATDKPSWWSAVFKQSIRSSYKPHYRTQTKAWILAVDRGDSEYVKSMMDKMTVIDRNKVLKHAICTNAQSIVELLEYSPEETKVARAMFNCDIDTLREMRDITIPFNTCRSVKLALSIYHGTRYEDTIVSAGTILPSAVTDIIHNVKRYGGSLEDVELLSSINRKVLENSPLDVVRVIVGRSRRVNWSMVSVVTRRLDVLQYALSQEPMSNINMSRVWNEALDRYDLEMIEWLSTLERKSRNGPRIGKTVASTHLSMKYVSPTNNSNCHPVAPEPIHRLKIMSNDPSLLSPVRKFERITPKDSWSVCDEILYRESSRRSPLIIEYLLNYFHRRGELTWRWLRNDIQMTIDVAVVVDRLRRELV